MSNSDPENIKGLEILDGLAARALDDDDYCRRLFDDPRSVLREAGMEVSDDVEVVVHQNSSDTIHLVLPSKIGAGQLLDPDSIRLPDVCDYIHF